MKNKSIMNLPSFGADPVTQSEYPQLQPVYTPAPPMPPAWTAVALLHPFSPPQSNDPSPDNPFFELCVANLTYSEGNFFSAQIAGCQSGLTWWYAITPNQTNLSTDQGKTWTPVDMGWSLPSDWFGGEAENANCAGSSPLNWMAGPTVDWWKVPVPNNSPSAPSAATWMWFDCATGAPVRMMFGQGPLSSPAMGDPTQLAIFQMYSFTYVPIFEPLGEAPSFPSSWTQPSFPGFAVGNPNNYQDFTWNQNFGMTVFMTPVNEAFNPLPTRVLYIWKPDDEYSVYTDRAQNTLMSYYYNPVQPPPPPALVAQLALLTGPAPQGGPQPPDSGTGFLASYNSDGTENCIGGSKFPFPQEPPDWVSIPGVGGQIQATITNNPVLCPDNTVTVFSVLFPPSLPNYPDSTYLWTWYAPQNADGTASRPVTFMQSQSGVGVGTSLALADYFYYQIFDSWIDPSNFTVPPFCSSQTRKTGLRHRLP